MASSATAQSQSRRPRRHRQRSTLVNKQQETVLAIWFGALWLVVLGLVWLLMGDSEIVDWLTGGGAGF
jgi:hypothetical protein